MVTSFAVVIALAIVNAIVGAANLYGAMRNIATMKRNKADAERNLRNAEANKENAEANERNARRNERDRERSRRSARGKRGQEGYVTWSFVTELTRLLQGTYLDIYSRFDRLERAVLELARLYQGYHADAEREGGDDEGGDSDASA